MAPHRAMSRAFGCLAYPLAFYGMARLAGDLIALAVHLAR